MKYFSDLGQLVKRLWADQCHNEDAFSEVALTAFRELPPHRHIHYMDVVKWVQNATEIPYQFSLGQGFGHPPLTVYTDGHFSVGVYFWLHRSIELHQHGFTGAFSVLEGGSLHVEYEFIPDVVYSQRLKTGEMRIKKALLLREGDAHPILPGGDLVHTLYHFRRPSVTVLIRTDYPPSHPQLV